MYRPALQRLHHSGHQPHLSNK